MDDEAQVDQDSGADHELHAGGLVCYDGRGKNIWQFDAPTGFGSMWDCYALNVATDAVWSCYYSGFPMVRIDSQRRVRAWGTALSGPRELAVSGDSVLVYGGYGEKETDCKLLRLREGQAEQTAEVNLRFPKCVELRQSTVVGRDKLLHVFTGDDWYMFSPEAF